MAGAMSLQWESRWTKVRPTKKAKDIQFMSRLYKEETGTSEVDLHELAKWMVGNGWDLPRPTDPMELLVRQISRALREETRISTVTGSPYRANHAYPVGTNHQGTFWAWIDIDEAERALIHKALQTRREQMVGDALQLSNDADHWNASHSDENPVVIQLDFTDDVEWRRNSMEDLAS